MPKLKIGILTNSNKFDMSCWLFVYCYLLLFTSRIIKLVKEIRKNSGFMVLELATWSTFWSIFSTFRNMLDHIHLSLNKIMANKFQLYKLTLTPNTWVIWTWLLMTTVNYWNFKDSQFYLMVQNVKVSICKNISINNYIIDG